MQISQQPKRAHIGLNSAAPGRKCLITFIFPKADLFILQFLGVSWTPSGG